MDAKERGSFCVYRHTSPNGKVYIGITGQPLARRWRNGAGYKAQLLFSRAIQKYGWENFDHEVLLSDLTEEQAKLAERLFIGYYDTTNRTKGYNTTIGGDSSSMLGRHHSKETKEKMSIKMREKYANGNAPRTGRKTSEETKRKISEAKRGKPCPEDAKRKISRTLTGRKLPIEVRQKMSEAQRGERGSMYGKTGAKHPNSKAVLMIDKDTNKIVKEFGGMKEAERQTGIKNQHISLCCMGKRKSAGGYVWRYKP